MSDNHTTYRLKEKVIRRNPVRLITVRYATQNHYYRVPKARTLYGIEIPSYGILRDGCNSLRDTIKWTLCSLGPDKLH